MLASLPISREGKTLEKRSTVFYQQNSRINNFPVVYKPWPTLWRTDSTYPLLSATVSTRSRRRLEEVSLQRTDHRIGKGVTVLNFFPLKLCFKPRFCSFSCFVLILAYALQSRGRTKPSMTLTHGKRDILHAVINI